MKIKKFNEKMVYDLTHIARLFVDRVEWVEQMTGKGYELNIMPENNEIVVSLFFDGKNLSTAHCKDDKWKIKSTIYRILESRFDTESQYGVLVGVRPVKVVHQMLEKNLEHDEIIAQLTEEYCIQPAKAERLYEVAVTERVYLEKDLDHISIYIGIPFCPSICTYCSFPSNDIHKKPQLVKPYVENLLIEIDESFKLAEKHGRTIDVIYIGGGTPSSIPNDLIESIFRKLESWIDLESLKELTFEAGRPDTIDEELLEILKRHHVKRICLNPQTLNDKVLEVIGRNHTGQDIIHAMDRIRRYGFESVNMDLIAGLPYDDYRSFMKTVDTVLEMMPENITVHTLAIKKASEIGNNLKEFPLPPVGDIEKILDETAVRLEQSGYKPYYLYRQKNILGNFENTGYALSQKESIYNIRIIEEKHPILALGVGGVSKRVHSDHETFDRIPNFRSVEEYLRRFDEMLEKKREFFMQV